MGTLVDYKQEIDELYGSIYVYNLSDCVKMFFDMINFGSRIDIFETEEEALNKLHERQLALEKRLALGSVED
ncbi:MAG: hypothetical protein F6K42_22840 [Leptolyngbya sp. SIO1D8]|nr:hypothetical protein [Leptolyngbya sp. SIO1D8]